VEKRQGRSAELGGQSWVKNIATVSPIIAPTVIHAMTLKACVLTYSPVSSRFVVQHEEQDKRQRHAGP
jgi:hypothetical protein